MTVRILALLALSSLLACGSDPVPTVAGSFAIHDSEGLSELLADPEFVATCATGDFHAGLSARDAQGRRFRFVAQGEQIGLYQEIAGEDLAFSAPSQCEGALDVAHSEGSATMSVSCELLSPEGAPTFIEADLTWSGCAIPWEHEERPVRALRGAIEESTQLAITLATWVASDPEEAARVLALLPFVALGGGH